MVVYPRWRGELFCALAFCWLSRGLSPLARGTLCRCQHCWRVIRFIPAGAGNTVPRIISLSSSTVYPAGAGTRRQRIVRLPLHRFIPAGAGNTGKTNIGVRVVPVYPRWRGEHSIRRFCSSSDAGLSPLARGTPRKRLPASLICRFIPAGAGNTKFILINTAFVSVYPRWRGEHKYGERR